MRSIDSPLLQSLRGGGREARSPVPMKDTIDFIYAYQRANEEQKGRGGALSNLNESDEDAEMDQQTMQNMRMREQASSKQKYGYGQESLDAGRAGMRDPPHQKARKPFELDLDNATLMQRRHRRIGQSPLVQNPAVNNGYGFDHYQTPGSPMQIG